MISTRPPASSITTSSREICRRPAGHNRVPLKKDARKAAWTSQELYTLARLLEAVHLYPEAARYYFALYNSPGADSQEKALSGLANILLVAPEQQVRFGAGDISMYKDIATMDAGPGYLNGILSLILNTSSPASHYSEEEQRGVPYFHRARAALSWWGFLINGFPTLRPGPACTRASLRHMQVTEKMRR